MHLKMYPFAVVFGKKGKTAGRSLFSGRRLKQLIDDYVIARRPREGGLNRARVTLLSLLSRLPTSSLS